MPEPPPLPDRVSSPPPAKVPGWLARQRVRWRPVFKQTWMNLKVWVPFLLNPADRARMATFLARERRTGLEWQVVLPEQCWQCARSDGLREREFETPIRSFEFPLPIAGLSTLCVLFFLLFAWSFLSWKMLLLAFISAAIGVGLAWVKSWPEVVSIRMSTCADHAREMKFPECVVDQGELYLFLPNAKLALATIAAAKAERLKKQGFTPFEGGAPAEVSGYSGGRSRQPDEPPADDMPRYRPPPPRKPVDLPPLKLDGDD